MKHLRFRRLDQGAAIFNEATWQTHILTPAATVIYEELMRRSGGRVIPEVDAIEILREDFELDPETPEIRQLLTMLNNLGVTR